MLPLLNGSSEQHVIGFRFSLCFFTAKSRRVQRKVSQSRFGITHDCNPESAQIMRTVINHKEHRGMHKAHDDCLCDPRAFLCGRDVCVLSFVVKAIRSKYYKSEITHPASQLPGTTGFAVLRGCRAAVPFRDNAPMFRRCIRVWPGRRRCPIP